MEPRYTVRYIINDHERRKTAAYTIRHSSGRPSESFILNEFQRLGHIVRVDGKNIKSVVIESIEES